MSEEGWFDYQLLCHNLATSSAGSELARFLAPKDARLCNSSMSDLVAEPSVASKEHSGGSALAKEILSLFFCYLDPPLSAQK